MTATAALTAQDKATLRTAAYGAVSLIAAADLTGSPHKAATAGTLALASATGPIGHLLAAKTKDIKFDGRNTAQLADQVLPALTTTANLLNAQAPDQAADFRSTVLVAVNAAARAKGQPSSVAADMIRKIIAALDA